MTDTNFNDSENLTVGSEPEINTQNINSREKYLEMIEKVQEQLPYVADELTIDISHLIEDINQAAKDFQNNTSVFKFGFTISDLGKSELRKLKEKFNEGEISNTNYISILNFLTSHSNVSIATQATTDDESAQNIRQYLQSRRR